MVLFPTCFGGFIPLRVSSSPGVLVILVAVGALDSFYSGDVVACGHLIRLEHSSVARHVNVFDMLHEVPTKSYGP